MYSGLYNCILFRHPTFSLVPQLFPSRILIRRLFLKTFYPRFLSNYKLFSIYKIIYSFLAPETTVAPIICYPSNLYLQSCILPINLKCVHIPHLLEKSTLEPDSLTLYRPISYLPFIYKVIERVVAQRFCSLSLSQTLPSPLRIICFMLNILSISTFLIYRVRCLISPQ